MNIAIFFAFVILTIALGVSNVPHNWVGASASMMWLAAFVAISGINRTH